MIGYGIDFGTTHSILSYYTKAEGVRSFVDDAGLPVPSVVWYSDKVVVGRQAKERMNTLARTPGHEFVRSIKSSLGLGKDVLVLGERKRPAEIAAEIFRHLKEMGAKSKHHVNEAVLTIPIEFNGRKRADLREAAGRAGIQTKTFLHEPFAAIVGYVLGQRLGMRALEGKSILVFDWGGGTLDITVAKVSANRIEQVAMGGMSNLAGDKFDELLFQFVINKFDSTHGITPGSVELSPRVRDVLSVECENAKIRLSERIQTVVQVEDFTTINGESVTLSVPVTQNEFVDQIRNCVGMAMKEVDKVLVDAGIHPELIAAALMTGGTCQIPFVQSEMRRRFRGRVIDLPNASTVISEGAAIISANNWRPFLTRAVKLELSDGTYYTIFDRGRPIIPEDMRKHVRLICTDNREKEARIVMAEERPDGSHKNCLIVNVPLQSAALEPQYLERVKTEVRVDENLIVEVESFGEICQVVKKDLMFDICFGLEIVEG